MDISQELFASRPGLAGPRERCIGLWVGSCGHFRARNHMVRQRRRDDFLLMYVNEGAGWIHPQSGPSLIARPGALLSCFPHLPHSYGADPVAGWDIWYCHFSGDVATRLMAQLPLQPDRPCWSAAVDAQVQAGFARIFELLVAGGPFAGLYSGVTLHALLVDCATRLTAAPSEQDNLLAAVTGHPDCLDAMAASVGMSRFHFSRRFKQVMGLSPWKYLMLLKMVEAKQLLTGTDWPVKCIAAELGFSDPDYFGRCFKQDTGLTPRLYRRQRP